MGLNLENDAKKRGQPQPRAFARRRHASRPGATITADKLSVSQLSAVAADLGNITAGSIALPSGGFVRSGQTAFDTGTGFYIGNDGGTPRMSLGSASKGFVWDGSAFIVRGDVIATGNIQSSAVTSDKIGSSAVSTDKVAANAVTNHQLATGGPVSTTPPVDILSRTITTSSGNPVLIAWSFGNTGNIRYSIKRGATVLYTFPPVGFNSGQACVSGMISDTPGTGTFTYTLRVEAAFSGSPTYDPIILSCTELKR